MMPMIQNKSCKVFINITYPIRADFKSMRLSYNSRLNYTTDFFAFTANSPFWINFPRKNEICGTKRFLVSLNPPIFFNFPISKKRSIQFLRIVYSSGESYEVKNKYSLSGCTNKLILSPLCF